MQDSGYSLFSEQSPDTCHNDLLNQEAIRNINSNKFTS